MSQRPPIGIIPRRFWDETRFAALESAMRRYIDAGFVLPEAWIAEHTELEEKLAGSVEHWRCPHPIVIIDRCRDCGAYVGPQP